jgi:hypothetical protein
VKGGYKQSGAGTEEVWEFDATQVRARGSTWRNEFTWDAFCSFTEDEKVTILNLNPGRSIVIPKRACTDGQITSLRELAAEHVRHL